MKILLFVPKYDVLICRLWFIRDSVFVNPADKFQYRSKIVERLGVKTGWVIKESK